MSEMIERVARAICADHYAGRFKKPSDDPHVQANVDGNWHGFATVARAAIEAMRDRDEAMLDAGTAVLLPHAQRLAPGSTAVAVYEAMLDAALTPSPEPSRDR